MLSKVTLCAACIMRLASFPGPFEKGWYLLFAHAASLASFIAIGLTDADSDPLGLGRSLCFEASTK